MKPRRNEVDTPKADVKATSAEPLLLPPFNFSFCNYRLPKGMFLGEGDASWVG
ncbi:MAG: hypothetical protein ACTSWP_07530 [Candidatus Freyarchaeota archaeon]|nr:hypothetical protein [Candidatus Freyrarchaeum guaymaensis]